MKQLLFLLLFPCLALAQYTGNAGQKITLGEQTTADGLVYRGLAADTTRKPIVDTMAYILLDTNTNIIWQYKKAVNNAWTRVGGSISSGVTGVLPVANGGTGSATQNFVDLTTTQSIDGAKTFTSNIAITKNEPKLFFNDNEGGSQLNYSLYNNFGFFNLRDETNSADVFSFGGGVLNLYVTADFTAFVAAPSFRPTGVTTASGNGMYLPAANTLGFSTNTSERMRITSAGAVTINDLAGTGSRAVLADANGVLSAPVSSITTKENVQTLNYGLNEILQINPVSFDYINKDKWGDERNLGFIVEDMFPIVPEVTGTMNNGDMYLDMTKLIPILTKAIQEQNALIKALEQRILTLENK